MARPLYSTGKTNRMRQQVNRSRADGRNIWRHPASSIEGRGLPVGEQLSDPVGRATQLFFGHPLGVEVGVLGP